MNLRMKHLESTNQNTAEGIDYESLISVLQAELKITRNNILLWNRKYLHWRNNFKAMVTVTAN